MKPLFIILVLFSRLSVHAQDGLPSYYTTVSNFCRLYALPPDGAASNTHFVKRQQGWFIQQVQPYPEKILQEHLWYNASAGRFTDLSAWYQPADGLENADAAIAKLLQPDGSSINWYVYDRARYYGYDDWHRDMIAAFGASRSLSDSLLDGLARAYSHQAAQYLWYQSGGSWTNGDSLQKKLARLQYPSPERLQKVKAYLNKSIDCYQRIEANNPAYQTIVGGIGLRVFNEIMHGYIQMIISGDEAGAAVFLNRATLDPRHVQQAKNHLNSCAPNAVLFTFGDNDTYQLWYVQQKLGYRKDIAIINNSLLGMSAYANMLRKTKLVNMMISDAFLNNEDAYYAVKKKAANKGKNKSPATGPLKETLLAIYNATCVEQTEDMEGKAIRLPAYLVDTTTLMYKTAANKPVYVKIPMPSFMYVNDLLTLDIILNNNNKRPVYFTSVYDNHFSNYLRPEGTLQRLYPADAGSKTAVAGNIKALEKFVKEVYTPVLSNNDGFICYDGDNAFVNIYAALTEYYNGKKDKAAANRWLEEMAKKSGVPNKHQTALLSYCCYLCTLLERKDLLQPLAAQYAQLIYAAWQQPDALQSSFSGKKGTAAMKRLTLYFQQLAMPTDGIDELLRQMEEN